jgi:hypothetical protein
MINNSTTQYKSLTKTTNKIWMITIFGMAALLIKYIQLQNEILTGYSRYITRTIEDDSENEHLLDIPINTRHRNQQQQSITQISNNAVFLIQEEDNNNEEELLYTTTAADRRKINHYKETTHECYYPLIQVNDTMPRGSHTINDVDDHENTTTTTSHNPRQKIPKVIRLASNTRCFTPEYVETVFERWQLWDGYEIRIYDNQQQNDFLLSRNWTNYFPRLQYAVQCLPHEGRSSATKVDIWKYLMLWEYGGIYTDLHNIPGPRIEKGFSDRDLQAVDGFMTVNEQRQPSPTLLAFPPKHPLMYLCVNLAVKRLLEVSHLNTMNTAEVTGQEVLQSAFEKFIGDSKLEELEEEYGVVNSVVSGEYDIGWSLKRRLTRKYPGAESWMIDRSIIIDGSPTRQNEYVQSNAPGEDKNFELYKLTGVNMWQQHAQHHSDLSCMEWVDWTQ